ncbi:MAG: hypothetical protein IJH41_03120 [Eubacterium sp.]|nr:hypothetical protein [Eubacterium sp.]
MKSNYAMKNAKRIMVIVLVIMMACSCVHMPGSSVYAEDEDMKKQMQEEFDLTPEQMEQLGNGEVELSSDQVEQLNAEADTSDAGFDVSEPLEVSNVDIEKIPADMSAIGQSGKKLNGNPGYEEADDGFQDDDDKFGEFVYSGSYPAITVDGTKTCDIDEGSKIITFEFTPSVDGIYWFWSEGEKDTLGRLVEMDDATGKYRQRLCEDNGGDGENFKFCFRGYPGKKYYLQSRIWYDDHTGSYTVSLSKDSFDPESAQITVDTSKNKSSHIVTVSGSVSGDVFDDLYIDNDACDAGISGMSSFYGVKIDMKKFGVGIHTLYAKLRNHSDEGFWLVYEYGIPTYIYKKPSIKYSEFLTTYNHVAYHYTGSGYDYCGVFFDWKKKGGKWSKLVGPVSTSSSEYTRESKKLKASTNYVVRTYFGKIVKYGGQNILISGAETNKYSSSKTVKTAGKKLSIKSAKISGVSQKKRKVTGWYWGYTRDPYYGTWNYSLIYGTRTIVTTKFKITVTLKKKPGTAGIYIGTHRIKGNKKKYSTDFNLEGKYKGKKVKFSFNSYQSSKYTSNSPYTRKKIKIK